MSALKPGLEGSPRASPAVLSMLTLKKYFSHPRFSYLLFSTTICKTETGTANRMTVFIRLFQGSSRALKRCAFFQSHSSLPVNPLDLTAVPHPRFCVSAGGDALI
jgi:hypothetical protein